MRLTTNKTMTTADRMRTGMVGSGNRYVVGGAGTGMFPERDERPRRRGTSVPWGRADWVMTGLIVAAAAGLTAAAFRLLGRVRWARVAGRVGMFYLTSSIVRQSAMRSAQGGDAGRRRGERRRTPRTGSVPVAAGRPSVPAETKRPSAETMPHDEMSLAEAAHRAAAHHPRASTEMEHRGGDIVPKTGDTWQEREPVEP